jgi:aminoglycoside phosphotransferase family enzyme
MPTLQQKLEFLNALCGPGDEALETHFAWVFLIGRHAYKLRKPVRRDTMDYSTLEARRLDCEQEVRLNRRLAPQVYLGTVALAIRPDGGLEFGGAGEAVEWLVKMLRLDRDLLLDSMLARGADPGDGLRRILSLLADFYRNAPAALGDGEALCARLAAQIEANRLVLEDAGLDRAVLLRDRQLRGIERARRLLAERAAAGCVVEGHGDLRPEHCYLGEPAAIIDCLEFDRELRVMDRAEELCFFELECAFTGHASQGSWLRRECLGHLGDTAPDSLLALYRSHRAATRAKLYVWRAGEPDGDTPDAWRARARRYLELALSEPLPPPSGRRAARAP